MRPRGLQERRGGYVAGVKAVILDVDGTLVDTNFQHAIAWHRAFRSVGRAVALWRIHRHIGMGGDRLVPELLGDIDDETSETVRSAEKEAYAQLIEEVEVMRGARDLVLDLEKRGHPVVLASSAKKDEVEHYLKLLDIRDEIDGATSSADVERTKPEPDLVKAALEAAGGGEAVMVGDSTWDCEAAERAGVPSVAVLTGGFSEQDLRSAGAVYVVQTVDQVRERLDSPPFTD